MRRGRSRTSQAVAVARALVLALALAALAPAVLLVAPAGSTTHRAPDDGVRPVGLVRRTFVDRSRSTPSDPIAGITPAPRRVLPTAIYYPARRSAGAGTVVADAPPARGEYPLVLFSPGSPGIPGDYEVMLADWAAHGYVVAALEFPISSVAGPDETAWRDLPAQTKDAGFVLDRVLGLDSDRAGIPEIDDERLAVAGHSFGGATALSLASKCCRDARVGAVVALAAVTETEHGPPLKRPAGPVLFVHARADRVVPYAPAVASCETAGAPKRLLTVEEIRGLRAHVDPYLGDDQYAAVVRPAIVDFLDGFVKSERAARARLDRTGAGTTVALVTRCRPGDRPTVTTASPAR